MPGDFVIARRREKMLDAIAQYIRCAHGKSLSAGYAYADDVLDELERRYAPPEELSVARLFEAEESGMGSP